MDLAARVARRYVLAEVVIPVKWFKDQAAKLRQILKTPVKEAPGMYRYVFQSVPEFFVQFEKSFLDLVSKDEIRESVSYRVQLVKARTDVISQRLEALGRALGGYAVERDAKQEVEWYIKYKLDEKLGEKVKVLGDLLKWSYRVEPEAISALADKVLKKATPQELASITDDNRYAVKYGLFRRVGLEQAAAKLIKREKIEWKADWVESIYEMLKANYSADSGQTDHELSEFALDGVKVVIFDPSVKGSDVKQYVRYLDEAHGRLKRRGLDSAWYGTIYIECESCGGVNQNTGKDKDVGGWYEARPNTVTVFIRPSSSVVSLVAHELGHRYWYKNLTSEQRARFESMVKVHTKALPKGVTTDFVEPSSVNAYKRSLAQTYRVDVDLMSKTKLPNTLAEYPAAFYGRVVRTLAGFRGKPTVSAKAENLWDRVKSYEPALVAQGARSKDLAFVSLSSKDEFYDKWFKDTVDIMEGLTKTALEYLEVAADGHNAKERERIMSTPEGKAYWESYEGNEAPVLPVSNYGRSNISEAFAEVFESYVMGEDMTRDQLESFRSVLASSRVAARYAADKPLTPEEQKLMGKVNVFVMDFVVDGGTLPREIEKINDLRRKLTPAESRKMIEWFNRTAPGDY